jgi:polyhydroxyalkanoate synthesis regulator phasin
MLELLKKTFVAGVGLAALTREKIEEFAKKLAEEGKMTEEEGKKLIEDLIKQSEESKKNIEKQIENIVESYMKKLDIASREDLKKLEKRVAKLEKAGK